MKSNNYRITVRLYLFSGCNPHKSVIRVRAAVVCSPTVLSAGARQAGQGKTMINKAITPWCKKKNSTVGPLF